VVDLVAKANQADLTASAEGAWRDGVWDGVVNTLQNKGAYPVKLDQPVKLAIGRQTLTLGTIAATFADGRVNIETFNWRDNRLVTRGSVSSFPAAFVLGRLPQFRAIASTLIVRGRWSLDIEERVNGAFELAREKGDLTIIGEQRLPLGLDQLAISARLVDNRANGCSSRQIWVAAVEPWKPHSNGATAAGAFPAIRRCTCRRVPC
jgi:translocation and assembly module TamB